MRHPNLDTAIEKHWGRIKTISKYVAKKVGEPDPMFFIADVILCMNRALWTYEGPSSRFNDYLFYRLSMYLIRQNRRRRKVQKLRDMEWRLTESSGPVVDWKVAFRDLTLTQKRCCELYYLQGWSTIRISREFNVSRQAIYDILKRANVSIKERIDQCVSW